MGAEHGLTTTRIGLEARPTRPIELQQHPQCRRIAAVDLGQQIAAASSAAIPAHQPHHLEAREIDDGIGQVSRSGSFDKLHAFRAMLLPLRTSCQQHAEPLHGSPITRTLRSAGKFPSFGIVRLHIAPIGIDPA
ncbi:hypothetical protein D9M68_941410 [compost metagenome]